MLITNVRSSLMGAYEWCPHKALISYVLGEPDPSGLAATKGTCAHKALELLAQRKLAEQEGTATVRNEELGREWPREELTPEAAVAAALDYYAGPNSLFYPWSQRDREDCRTWVNTALEAHDGAFSPLRRQVVVPEQFFDLEVPRGWALYDYQLPGWPRLSGRLRVRGTIDLVTEVEPGVLEVIDWKTGRRLDWARGTVKELDDLRNDKQFLLYYWALRRVFPQYHTAIFTVFYLRDGGPFTIPFDDDDLVRAENMLRDFFQRARADALPRRIKPSWKCDRLCAYAKPGPEGKDLCDTIHEELLELGIDRVTARRADRAKLNRYTGGGRTEQ